MKRFRIDIDLLATLAGWRSAKSLRNAVDRKEIALRAEKIGGRYAPCLADVIDAALARPLIDRGVKIETAFQYIRPAIDRLFDLRPGKDIDPESMLARSCEPLLECIFKRDELVDVRSIESLEALIELRRAPAGANFRFAFEDGTVVLLFSVGDAVAGIVERAQANGFDLSQIEHGSLT